jgi:hypothetical protein
LSQRIALFGWIEEKHLDAPEEDGSKGFMMFAQQGLLRPTSTIRKTNNSSRITENQPLQGPQRQTDLHLELLQGHIWSAVCRAIAII